MRLNGRFLEQGHHSLVDDGNSMLVFHVTILLVPLEKRLIVESSHLIEIALARAKLTRLEAVLVMIMKET